MKLITGSAEFEISNFNYSIYYDDNTDGQDSIIATLKNPTSDVAYIADAVEEDFDGSFKLEANDGSVREFSGYALKSIGFHIDDIAETLDIRFEKVPAN